MESEHEQFRRLADGVIGVGFIQTHTGIPTAAIAWPDREPSRYVLSDLNGVGVELMLDEGHLPQAESDVPDEQPQAETQPVVAPVTETVTEPPQPVVESVETTTSSEPVVQTATDEQLTAPAE